MSNNKQIHGLFDDDELTYKAAKALVEKGIRVKDVFSPFPIHGIDPVIGVPRTNLHIAGFIYGLCGICLALFMFWFTMIHDWPINVGGKPNNTLFSNLPAFIPVTFEMTVFLSAHGMVLSYLIVNRMYPGKKGWNPDPRTTDDKFLIQVDLEDNPGHSADEVKEILKAEGAEEINELG